MAALLLLLAALVLSPAVHHVVGDKIDLSIDCGLNDTYSGYTYTDTGTNIYYVSDGQFVDAGENYVVAAAAGNQGTRVSPLESLRSFPSGQWNCYALPTEAQVTYLVRAQFAYGNYDRKNSSLVQFELHLGPNRWDTITVTPDQGSVITKEAVFVAWASWAPVCLVNTGGGTPFVSVVELRRLGVGFYPPVSTNQSMSTYARLKMGTKVATTRHPDDPNDRIWSGMTGPQWINLNLSTQDIIQPDTRFGVPSAILQTAVAAAGNNTSLTIMTGKDYSNSNQFMTFLHFADFQNTQVRQFDIFVNGIRIGLSPKPYSPLYLEDNCMYGSDWYRASDGKHNITLVGTTSSVLPPMLNAIEIYTLVDLDDAPLTFPQDFDAIIRIKLEYGVKKNWTGDPCFTLWIGLKCSDISSGFYRITSIYLSNSSLTGPISQNFTLLTALESLDLSYNNLNGLIPDSLPNLPSLQVLNLSGNQLNGPFPRTLCQNHTGLVFSYESDAHMCGESPSRKRVIVIAVSVVVPMLVVALLIIGCFLIRTKTIKHNVSSHDPARDSELQTVSGIAKNHGDYLQNTENRQFSYKDLEKLTNNFQRFIGHGGFGKVYYGRLENGSEVAVKMRSDSSLHGLDEFLAEVQSLTKVHHRNLVSLVGYCWQEDHLALVYEYMSQGSLFDHLRGKHGAAETLNWETRVRVVLEAALGLDYLHKGCSPPIIHRDVKTSNILLGRNLEAKIADFGLCKTYLSDSQSHISAPAAGSAGYIDPEYYQTARLTESSDVFSFGVVLLEVATGRPPIVTGHGHIIQHVNQMITAGDDISNVADARLGGSYDVNSMWKVVDTAMMCTAESVAQRPTMAAVVAQLKESLALEEAREKDSSVRATLGGDVSALLSTFGPSAR